MGFLNVNIGIISKFGCWEHLAENKSDWVCNLTTLHLKKNKLTTLPESIGNLTNLTKLDLYKYQLTFLPESIENLTNFTHLILSGNKLNNYYLMMC